MQPDEMIHRLAEKTGAGNRTDAHVSCQRLAEFQIRREAEFGNVKQNIVSALGRCMRDADIVKTPEKEVPGACILLPQGGIVVLAEAQPPSPPPPEAAPPRPR